MLEQVPIFKILVQILMVIEYENSTVEYIYRYILHIVCITFHVSVMHIAAYLGEVP